MNLDRICALSSLERQFLLQKGLGASFDPFFQFVVALLHLEGSSLNLLSLSEMLAAAA
jgi:hypothetical protein